ncbi:MAG: hypothetical protein N2749_00520 [Clostridia bacterium]|nr:hypothetical protein [Clostridia bacterium]
MDAITYVKLQQILKKHKGNVISLFEALNDGYDGDFNPGSNINLAGIYRFNSINIPTGVTIGSSLSYLILISRNPVIVNGAITVSGMGGYGGVPVTVSKIGNAGGNGYGAGGQGGGGGWGGVNNNGGAGGGVSPTYAGVPGGTVDTKIGANGGTVKLCSDLLDFNSLIQFKGAVAEVVVVMVNIVVLAVLVVVVCLLFMLLK